MLAQEVPFLKENNKGVCPSWSFLWGVQGFPQLHYQIGACLREGPVLCPSIFPQCLTLVPPNSWLFLLLPTSLCSRGLFHSVPCGLPIHQQA